MSFILSGAVSAAGAPASPASSALRIDAAVPRYVTWQGSPRVLVGSSEHYGALINPAFNYVAYLDEVQRCGLNVIRIFAGTYFEIAGEFEIAENTLAPAPGTALTPYARSTVPGPAEVGARFDLSRWNDAYWKRLDDLLRQADQRGIVVEYVIFSAYYSDVAWARCPFAADANTNGIGQGVTRATAYTQAPDSPLEQVRQQLIAKVAEELARHANVYVEMMNEPYIGPGGKIDPTLVPLAWQRAASAHFARSQQSMSRQIPIAVNVGNGSSKAPLFPEVGILNFHYAMPPDAIAANWDARRVIGDDETGFKGTLDATYRREAWEFLIAGGGIFNHLDYSFTIAKPDGSHQVAKKFHSGGSRALREQLGVLRRFLDGFDPTQMQPAAQLVTGGIPAKGGVRALSSTSAHAVYVHGGTSCTLALALPAGRWRATWISTASGATAATADIIHAGGSCTMVSPTYVEDIALSLRAVP